ncbi:MAG: vWA domain-containing protein [Bacteroidia bacterium]
MKLVYPENTYWLLLLPLFIVALVWVYRRANQILSAWFSREQYKKSQPFLKTSLRTVGILLALVATLGPYFQKQDQSVNILAREIYVLLDVSASMNVEDVRPSRLKAAKKEIHRLLGALKGDHIGLIAFASHPYTQCAITRDIKAVTNFLDLVETEQYAQTGTDLRNALLMASERFSSTERPSAKISRSIVLMTDGEDFGENYTSVIEKLHKNGITVFVVGIGTVEGGSVPELVNGKMRGHKRRADGTIVNSSLNEASLQALSQEFGTTYYSLSTPEATIRPVIEEIKEMNASPIAEKVEKTENNLFEIFLFLAIICLASSLFLMPVKS